MPFFFFNDTATTEIYTLSLHDALPICLAGVDQRRRHLVDAAAVVVLALQAVAVQDRKSTRLNSSHANISYAVFCLIKIRFPPDARSASHVNIRYQAVFFVL